MAISTSLPPSGADRPTRIRHLVVFLTTAVAVLLYLDRICLSIVERYIKDDLGLTNSQIGVLLSAFFWAYALGQVPAGWLSDRYGARLTLALYVILWSTFTGLMGLAAGLVVLLLLRLSCGLTEAGAYPACASLLSRWVPAARRGLASGIVSIGGRLGGAIAPVLTAYLVIVFVPLRDSSLLTSADISDPRALARLILKPDKKTSATLALAVRKRLPPETDALIHSLASSTSDAPLSVNQSDVLLTGLNKVIMDPSLRDDIDPAEMALPAAKDRSLSRGAPEVERDNRLMLEAGFPTAVLALYRGAWRPVMMIYGVVGVAVGAVFWLFFRDRPRLHPGCNAAEIALIEGEAPIHNPDSAALIRLLGRPGARLPVDLIEAIRERLPADSAVAFHELSLSASVKPPDEQQVQCVEKGLNQLLLDPGLRDKVARAIQQVEKSSSPIQTLARDRNLWLISLAAFGTNFGWVYLFTWFPRFLLEVHKVPVAQRSLMTGIPLLIGIPGLYLGGWLTDFITGRAGRYRGRCVLLSASRFVVLLAFGSCLWLHSPWLVTAAMVLVSFGTDLGTPAFWAYSQDVGGRHVGSVLGWLNMWGNVGAALLPIAFAPLVDRGLWNLQFAICALAFLVAAVATLAVDPTRPIAFEQTNPSAA